MDKPFGVLVIGLAMFVTIGALATSSLKTPGSRPAAETDIASTEHVATTPSSPQPRPQTAGKRAVNSASPTEIERGLYLVEEVAKCPECHTPRNDRGELRQDAWLSGA